MFQVLEFEIAPQERLVIDDDLKAQYEGITGITVWTPDIDKLRMVELELKIDQKEVFPQGFPAELFSCNTFRNVEDCTYKKEFPKNSKIEGSIFNGNITMDDPNNIDHVDHTVQLKLILFIKL